MATSRPAIPKRTDAAKLRADQRAIAEDFVKRETIRMQGDTVSPKPAPSPAEQGVTLPKRKQRRISSQGIARNTGRPNTTI